MKPQTILFIVFSLSVVAYKDFTNSNKAMVMKFDSTTEIYQMQRQ